MRNWFKWFRRNWLKSLKYTIGLLIIGGSIWAGIILYHKDNWIGISAVATLLLALGAFLTIRQNYCLHARERRERLLNEIIEWATQILECGRAPTYIAERFKVLNGKNTSRFEFELNMTAMAAFNVLTWKAVHIGFLAQYSVRNEGLKDAVEDARTLLRQHLKIVSLALDKKLKDAAAQGRHRDKVDKQAKKVIELAVKLL